MSNYQIAMENLKKAKENYEKCIITLNKIKKNVVSILKTEKEILIKQEKIQNTLVETCKMLPSVNEKIADNFFNLAKLYNFESKK